MVKKKDEFLEKLSAMGVHGVKIVPIKPQNKTKLEVEVKKYNSWLDLCSRTKEQLIVPVEYQVEAVTFYGRGDRSFTPHSEMVMGGRSPEYPLGDSYSCDIVVNGAPLKQITFIGWPAIQKGDRVKAYIFAAEEKGKKYLAEGAFFGHWEIRELKKNEDTIYMRSVFDPEDRKNPFVLVQRDFKEKERAMKIEKIDNLGKILAVYIDSGFNER
jgi:hypothetical protein